MVIDTSALVAVVLEEPERDVFTDILARQPHLATSAASVFEASLVVATRKSKPKTATLVDDLLSALEIEIAPFEARMVRDAREAYFRFGKGYHPARVNLRDCFAYALAKSLDVPLLFKGDDFAKTDIMPAWRPTTNERT
jgi:ribonuclease VapC